MVDRHWGLVLANRAIGVLTADVAGHLLEPPVNVLRLTLHPDGLASRIVNLPEWRSHLLDRLGRESVTSDDPALAALHDELAAYPGAESRREHDLGGGEIAVPLRVRSGNAELAFISTLTRFGTATDVTVSELSLESFFPADSTTGEYMRALARMR